MLFCRNVKSVTWHAVACHTCDWCCFSGKTSIQDVSPSDHQYSRQKWKEMQAAMNDANKFIDLLNAFNWQNALQAETVAGSSSSRTLEYWNDILCRNLMFLKLCNIFKYEELLIGMLVELYVNNCESLLYFQWAFVFFCYYSRTGRISFKRT